MSTHQPASPEAVLAQEDFIRALARQLLRDPGAADDVTQDTLVTALHHGPAQVGRLRGWMAAVARNGARQSRRGESRRRRRELEIARPENGVPSPEEIADREEARRRVVQAVLALEADHRDALVLRYWEGLDAKTMATRLGLSVEGARTRLKRAHARLRAELMQREGRDWRQAIAPVAFGGVGAGAAGTLLAVGWKVAAAALIGVGLGATLVPGTRTSAAPVGGEAGPQLALVDGEEEATEEGLAGVTSQGPSERREAALDPAATTGDHRMRVRVVDQDGEPLAGSELWIDGLLEEPTSVDAAEWELFEVEDHSESPAQEPAMPRRGLEEGFEDQLGGLGYAGEAVVSDPEDLTVSAVTDDEGWAVFHFEEETRGSVQLMSVPGEKLSLRHLKPTRIETGGGSHVIVVPRMSSASVELEVRALGDGQLLDEYEVDVFRGGQAVVESLQAEEGRAVFTLPVHPLTEEELDPTVYRLEVRAPGIAPVERTLRMLPGEKRALVLRHGWERRIVGVVQGADGLPVAGAVVAPGDTVDLRRGVAYLPYVSSHEDGVLTDQLGRFELMTAAATVSAHHPEHGAATASSDGEVVLVLSGLGSIHGEALAPDGKPLADVAVQLDHRGASRTDATGHYRIEDVEPGVHQIGVAGNRAKVEVAVGEELEFNFDGRLAPMSLTIPGFDGYVSVFGEQEQCSILSRGCVEGSMEFPRALPGSYWLISTGQLLVRVDLMPGAQTVPVPTGSLVVSATPDEHVWLLPAGVSAHVDSLIQFSKGRDVPSSGRLSWTGVAPGDYDLLRLDGRRDRVRVGAGEVTYTLKD